ncbi:hypothetical protein B0H34DRAFT_411554 [Crassisporium funariophilum]|nr:hypothetical protein B0H34DRAFT_411554 [Crassisporium funariophilum]
MSFLPLTASRPDKHRNRSAWNASWEKDLETWLHPPQPSVRGPLLYTKDNAPGWVPMVMEIVRSEILVLQNDICERAVMKANLTEDWVALEPARRKDIVLEALYNTSCIGPDMEQYRQWCPDMTVEALGNKGEPYIKLLEFLVRSNSDSRQEITLFPHPLVDKVFGLEALQVPMHAPKSRLERCYFVTLVIWRIYLAFYGLTEVSRFKKLPEECRKAIRSSIAVNKEERHRARKNYIQSSGDTRYCWGCGIMQSLLPGDKKLLACAECKKMGVSEVKYCSRECQKDDWKNGKPKPHKLTCGKPPQAAAEGGRQGKLTCNDKTIPSADPSFKRSLALLHQIQRSTATGADYVLITKGNDDIGLTIPGKAQKDRFLEMKQQAMKNGDVTAVKGILEMLRSYMPFIASVSSGFTLLDLKEQLEREYGVKL